MNLNSGMRSFDSVKEIVSSGRSFVGAYLSELGKRRLNAIVPIIIDC